MYDMAHPFGSSCLVKNDCAIKNKAARPSRVATMVCSEHAHGFFHRARCLHAWRSSMLSAVMSFAIWFIVGLLLRLGGYGAVIEDVS